MNTWELLRGWSERRGETERALVFRTTLLGRVPYHEENGVLVSDIPEHLQKQARDNGFEIVAAFFREGQYLLQPIPVKP